jgi:hypothetical protein
MLRNMSFLVSSFHTVSFRLDDLEEDSWPNNGMRPRAHRPGCG